MPITLADIRDDYTTFPDGMAVSVRGNVKIAWEPKPQHPDFGTQQGFILVGDDGAELNCQLGGGKNDQDGFTKIQTGDLLEIYTHQNPKTKAPAGTKLTSYVPKTGQKAGQRVRQLNIYGLRHVRVLNRQIGVQAPQQQVAASPANPQAQQHGSAPVAGKMDENAWLLLYGRAFARLAQFFEPRMPSTPKGGAFELALFLESAPVEILDIIHRGATSLCIAVQDGKVVLAQAQRQTPAEPPPTPPAEQPPYRNITPGATPDPPWMQDNDGDPGPWSQE
jgi:hypothetical protein